jgi:hypothetical protein
LSLSLYREHRGDIENEHDNCIGENHEIAGNKDRQRCTERETDNDECGESNDEEEKER